MLLVKEIRRVSRVQRHGDEALVQTQHRAGPLPDAAHLGLASEDVAAARHGHGVPVLEADVGAVEVEEELRLAVLVGPRHGGGGRGRDFDAVVGEVARGVSVGVWFRFSSSLTR